jgi:chitinase
VTFRATTTPGSATSPSDFPAKTGELVTIFAGQTAGYLGFKMPVDNEVEGTETFTLTLSDPSGATIGTPVVTATILDRNAVPMNPALAAVTITDASVTEGNAGASAAIFTVSLPAPATSALTVAWATADATATAGSDYNLAVSTVTFQPGETAKTIIVLVHGDTRHEIDETFTVVLANGKVGTARIINDDPVAPRHRPSGS